MFHLFSMLPNAAYIHWKFMYIRSCDGGYWLFSKGRIFIWGRLVAIIDRLNTTKFISCSFDNQIWVLLLTSWDLFQWKC